MPLKIRYIPRLTRDVLRRATPAHVLMLSILKTNQKFPLQPDFVRQVLQKAPDCEEYLQKNAQILKQFEETAEKIEAKLEITPSGFAFPLGGTQNFPFHITRTKSGNIPIYLEYRKGRTQVVTLVRKYEGDVQALQAELMKLTGKDVEQRPGHMEIIGHHARIVRLWLRALGF